MWGDMEETYIIGGYDIRDIQNVMLDILMAIDKVCEENGIGYVLMGGTLLGAIRHQGFIPWDDDADIMMTRDDYDRFMKVAEECLPEGYVFQCMENTEKYPYNFGKVFASETLYTESGTAHLPICHGVYVDVFPMDYVSEKDYLHQAKMVSHYTDVRYYKLGMIHEWRYAPFALAPLSFLNHMADRHMRYYKKDKDKLCQLCHFGPHKPVTDRSFLTDTIRVPFWGKMLPVPREYDRYLTMRYGDYMTPPPKEKQRPTHNIKGIKL